MKCVCVRSFVGIPLWCGHHIFVVPIHSMRCKQDIATLAKNRRKKTLLRMYFFCHSFAFYISRHCRIVSMTVYNMTKHFTRQALYFSIIFIVYLSAKWPQRCAHYHYSKLNMTLITWFQNQDWNNRNGQNKFCPNWFISLVTLPLLIHSMKRTGFFQFSFDADSTFSRHCKSFPSAFIFTLSLAGGLWFRVYRIHLFLMMILRIFSTYK